MFFLLNLCNHLGVEVARIRTRVVTVDFGVDAFDQPGHPHQDEQLDVEDDLKRLN